MKVYKAEDVIRAIDDAFDNIPMEQTTEMLKARRTIRDLPTIEVSEEDELKFYYVDSIDAYWIGQRLDNFYYAEWVDELGFVWTRSRYLPWGEHVINPQTLWKEYTYPSEPREIPFTEWIVGFMKKHTSEDVISREDIVNKLKSSKDFYLSAWGGFSNMDDKDKARCDELDNCIATVINAESVVSKLKASEWITEYNGDGWNDYWDYTCPNCGNKYERADAVLYKANFCPNCGSKMKGVKL